MRRVSILCFVVLALTVAFWSSPAQAVEDWYWVEVDSTGWVVNGGGSGYNGGQWYYYPDTYWWNEWFYNAPFDPERKKEMEVYLWIEPLELTAQSWVTIAYNWSTDKWAATGNTGPPLPPFAPGEEDAFIGRHVIYDGPVPMYGLSIYDRMYILDYNPEWVSIDVKGYNFVIPNSTIWHECQPVKWKQLPDLTPNGIDIKVDDQHWLGDDFECTTTGPLTGIHFWVSYLWDDYVDYAIDTIHVEIYDDDPAGPGGTDPYNTHSMPDQMLWDRDFTRAEFLQRLYAVVDQEDPPGEYWWDPATAGSLIQAADQNIYQIDIDISQDDTFIQRGTPDEPKIYWLVVQIRKNPNYWGEIGWKTRRWPDHFMDDAVFDIGSELPRIWKELRYPPGHPYSGLERDSIDLAFVIQGKEKKRFEPVKWSQPPVPDPQYPPEEPYYLGWDEESVVTPQTPVIQPRPFCADDFYCLGPKPVTKIHWWGSFTNWDLPYVPAVTQLPQAFQIGFWTDVPADPTNPDIPYSHPGEMVWEIYCYDYQLEFYGWDINPETGLIEAKFQFNQDFKPEEWFHQLRENEIYWVSIAADYGDWATDPQYIWGWETRPHFYQDDAVRIIPQMGIPPHPGYVLDPFSDVIEEIIHPDGTSWDLAYELGTDPDYIKWEQRFDPLWDQNTDIKSQARYDPATAEKKIVVFEAIVADDWPCRDTRPILAVEWWGSYLGYDGSAGIVPPRKPDFFLLTIWTDMPANDPANLKPYSHPDQRIWTYRAHNYVQVPVGKETINNEVVFQYFVNLPNEKFFYQEPDPDNPNADERIYWLSVVAVYPDGIDIDYDWGWTNHEHVFMDDAAYVDVATTPVDPWQFDWQELRNPTSLETWDMSFVLETTPGKEEKRFEPVKWSQPPVPDPQYPPEEKYYLGWDEDSVVSPPTGVVQPLPFCADDFYCLGPKPVTKIHWWGSFQDWAQPEIPDATLLPQAFQIGFWTDVPADPANPDISYSHPGEMVWEIYCEDYELEFYGWDHDPWAPTIEREAKFQFLQKFKPEEWFHQLYDNEIYWVSIAADYGDWATDPQYIWGWETRPHFYQDDAVRIYPLQANVPPHPGYVLDPHFDKIEEIIHPDGTSWDLAFELGTEPNYIKWEQRFDPDWPGNDDIISMGFYNALSPEITVSQVVADDWPCRDDRPILAVEWWGSYLGYNGIPGVALPVPPEYFLLTIWTDRPDTDPAEPNTYSRPEGLVWEYRANNYLEVAVGQETMSGDVVYKYYVNLPPDHFFFQEPNPDGTDERIYWLSIMAVYPEVSPVPPPYDWGWTNHEHVFLDDAVWGYPRGDPWWSNVFWWPLEDYLGNTADQSFVLETTPDCYIVGQPRYYDELMNPGPPITPANYAAWVASGKPDCWCCPHHGYGDVNGDGAINPNDIPIVWNAVILGLSPVRADVNHDGAVNPNDIPPVWNTVQAAVGPLPNTCPDCPYVP